MSKPKGQDIVLRRGDDFVFGEASELPEDRHAEAIEYFLNSGDPGAVAAEFVAERSKELANPRWWQARLAPSQQVEIATRDARRIYRGARKTLREKNRLVEEAMVHASSAQRYEVLRAEQAVELASHHVHMAKYEADIAEQRRRRAEQEAAIRKVAQPQPETAGSDDLEQIEARLQELREYTEQLAQELDAERSRSDDQAERLENERRRAAALAEQLRDAQERHEAEKQSAEYRRAQELAEEEHRTALGKQKLEQALFDARIRGAVEPTAARQRRAERRADKEARMVQETTTILSELAHRAQRDIAAAEKKYGADSEIVERVKNHWDAKLRELSTTEDQS